MIRDVPAFNSDGVLPPGDYDLTIAELASSWLVSGPASRSTWDTAWRRNLVENLGVLVEQLFEIGIDEIFANGSFVEDKDHPNDIDGYFVCDQRRLFSGELERALNQLDPYKIWTWDPATRRLYRASMKKQLPMWHQYRVELYPHVKQPSGIKDAFGNDLEFPAAFRQSRKGTAKGIIRIVSQP